MKICVIDYGLGNLASVYNALLTLGGNPRISDLPEDIEKADKIVLPGVGSFQDAMLGLEKRGLAHTLKKAILSGKLYLGICLGLQILFEKSEEGKRAGLSILKGRVKRFDEKTGVKVPHIGWNTVSLKSTECKLFRDIEEDAYFYFDHSYYGEPEEKSLAAGNTKYGISFSSVIHKDNIYAVQFHPERSQGLGLEVLKNFINL